MQRPSAGSPRVWIGQSPQPLKGKTKVEQEKILEELSDKRVKLQKNMKELQSKRDKHLVAERKKAPKDSFDAKVIESIRKQASKIGIKY